MKSLNNSCGGEWVPYIVYHDYNLPLLLENNIFGNKMAQDGLYHHFSTPKNRATIFCVRKDDGSIWHMV